MKPLFTLLALLLHLTLSAQSSGFSLSLAQGLTLSNWNVHLASDLSLGYSVPIKTDWSATFAVLLARSVVETDLQLPNQSCNSSLLGCLDTPVSLVGKELRAGFSFGLQRHWNRLSFGIFVQEMARINNRVDVHPQEFDPLFFDRDITSITTRYGERFDPIPNAEDSGDFIANSDRFRLQLGLRIESALNETISVGLTSRLDVLTPNLVELQSIGGFRPNPEIPNTIFQGRSRAYYFQGSFRVVL